MRYSPLGSFPETPELSAYRKGHEGRVSVPISLIVTGLTPVIGNLKLMLQARPWSIFCRVQGSDNLLIHALTLHNTE